MRIDRLLLRNFRNYDEAEVYWHPELNLIYGENAQGKSNILEAIDYLSTTSSFREQKDEILAKRDAGFFFLEAEIDRTENGLTDILTVGWQNNRRLWKKNNQLCRRLSEAAGFLHTVIFTPDDLEIIKKGPDTRRRFLDREMLQLFTGYAQVLSDYKKALTQRNNLLKQIEAERIFRTDEREDLLLPWETELARLGAQIIKKRAETIERLSVIACENQKLLSGGREELRLEYECKGADPNKTLDEIWLELTQALAENRNEDIRRGITTVGPHRDDFRIFINEEDARYYGSQGQQRTAALAVKLSEIELAHQVKGYYPVLLLDDVLSELDENRREAVLSLMVGRAQVFITTTEIGRELKSFTPGSYKLYHVEKGHISEDI